MLGTRTLGSTDTQHFAMRARLFDTLINAPARAHLQSFCICVATETANMPAPPLRLSTVPETAAVLHMLCAAVYYSLDLVSVSF